jgi:hypothetical protein
MMIKKLVTGCLQKLNLKSSGKTSSLPHHFIYAIENFQKEHPEMLLCGSVALILNEALPYRKVHDIDFVINRQHFDSHRLGHRANPYTNEVHDGYYSHEIEVQDILINMLVFDDDIKLNEKTIISPFNTKIKCQDINDILLWKRKYNRPKDIEDLNNINKAIEDAIFR